MRVYVIGFMFNLPCFLQIQLVECHVNLLQSCDRRSKKNPQPTPADPMNSEALDPPLQNLQNKEQTIGKRRKDPPHPGVST